MKINFIRHLKYLSYSLYLDREFLLTSPFSFLYNLKFTFLKYFILAKHLLIDFKFGKSCVTLDKTIFYNSVYGLVDYQASIVHHYNLIKLSKLEKPEVIIDIGSNVGFFIFLTKKLFPDATIFGIEPLPNIFAALSSNVGNLDGVILSNVAVGDEIQSAKMIFDSVDTYQSRISQDGKVSIQVTTLDELLKDRNLSKVDLLKIDVEGFEEKVLRGAHGILSISKYLILEIITSDDQVIFSKVVSKLHNPPHYSFQIRGIHNFDRHKYYVSGADYLFENVLYKIR